MHPIWSGSISFGLINIPIRIYSASIERPFKFKLLDRESLCPISYLRVCKFESGETKEIPYENIVRGYEYSKNNFAILSDDDFKRANPEKTSTIEILSFCKSNEISPKFFNKPYYLEPEEKSGRAYSLFRSALHESQTMAIGKFVIKNKEHLASIYAEDDLIILNELRFESEFLPSKNLNMPSKTVSPQKEIDIAISLIKKLEEPFNPKQFKDTYNLELQEIIKRRIQGKKISSHPPEKRPKKTAARNLMKMLKLSLEKAKTKN